MSASWSLRTATEADIPALEELIPLSVRTLQAPYYSPEQMTAALGPVFGVDRALIRDGTYFAATAGDFLVGGGGWSRRKSLYGGDGHRQGEDPLLDPAVDPARIRAFFVHPDWARQGIGRAILSASEAAIVAHGFHRAELVATLAGEPLYIACGYTPIERFEIPVNGAPPLGAILMGKAFA